MQRLGNQIGNDLGQAAQRQQANAAQVVEDYKTFYRQQAAIEGCNADCTNFCLNDNLAQADFCVMQNCSCNNPIKVTETQNTPSAHVAAAAKVIFPEL